MYTFLKNYEHDNECFINAYSGDIAKIQGEIKRKKENLGLADSDVKFKLKEIDLKLRELGGKLDVPLL